MICLRVIDPATRARARRGAAERGGEGDGVGGELGFFSHFVAMDGPVSEDGLAGGGVGAASVHGVPDRLAGEVVGEDAGHGDVVAGHLGVAGEEAGVVVRARAANEVDAVAHNHGVADRCADAVGDHAPVGVVPVGLVVAAGLQQIDEADAPVG